ncbi:MAG: tetratricopeptide repeat protein [Phycisphaerae bacterium]|nr:tetratricopeptide repeat protein [Phycisphaerae bacterium]
MVEAVIEELEAIVEKETWTAEDRDAILAALFAEPDAAGKMRTILNNLESANPEPKGMVALKIGIARYMLCRFEAAVEVFGEATDNGDRRYFQGMCCKYLKDYAGAQEELLRARDRGWDRVAIELELIEIQALVGDIDAADKALAKLAKKLRQDARYYYLRGLVDEVSGKTEAAADGYIRARQIDENHDGATFRLAYFYDLHGQEEEAIELYQQCLMTPPIYANARLNLAVLYEDAGQYDMAIACLRRILATNPAHARARLFLKDVEASKTMYYDEDQAKLRAHRNALLDIPVTDFELSVRARNCLKKLNIRTLGDLIETSEPELMGYKNFGETSLKEIRLMMSAKGLKVGQALEEGGEYQSRTAKTDESQNVQNEGVLATPTDQIPFSKRVRKALETLRVSTLGDLTARTDAELLACENFGQTSLNEVRERLTEYGLALREPE